MKDNFTNNNNQVKLLRELIRRLPEERRVLEWQMQQNKMLKINTKIEVLTKKNTEGMHLKKTSTEISIKISWYKWKYNIPLHF